MEIAACAYEALVALRKRLPGKGESDVDVDDGGMMSTLDRELQAFLFETT